MAAPGKPTGTVQHRVYAKNSGAIAIAPAANYAGVVGAGKLIASIAAADLSDTQANFVLDATVAGPVDANGNPVSYTPLGSGTTKSVAGAAELGEVPLTFVVTESNTVHDALLDSEIGDNIEFAVAKIVGAAVSVYYGYGEVTGISVGFDTPADATISIALKARPKRFKAA